MRQERAKNEPEGLAGQTKTGEVAVAVVADAGEMDSLAKIAISKPGVKLFSAFDNILKDAIGIFCYHSLSCSKAEKG
jgi:hypothetical protein